MLDLKGWTSDEQSAYGSVQYAYNIVLKPMGRHHDVMDVV